MGPATQPLFLLGRARVPCRRCGARPAAGWGQPALRNKNRKFGGRADVGIGPYGAVYKASGRMHCRREALLPKQKTAPHGVRSG